MIISDWLDFANKVKNNKGLFREESQVLKFIDKIFDKQIKVIEKGTHVYRARLTEIKNIATQNETLIGFLEKESMSPKAKLATAQRASPEKISYLYVAQDLYTALSEIRPSILSFISLAEIEILEDIIFFDFWIDISASGTMSEFAQLAISFSAVIAEVNKKVDYLPMQYIAEYIRKKGVDGIRYTSLQSQGGKNLVVFNKEKAGFVNSKILYTENVSYSFLDITRGGNKTFVSRAQKKKLPEDFAERIKSAVLAMQEKKKISDF